jgi:uncharacterized Zn finger protein (UPF0148 family)
MPIPQDTPDGRVHCPECGSTYFYDAEFRQYGSGGGLSPSDHTWSTKICMCGHPLLPGIASSRDAEVCQSLEQSIHAAQEQRARTSPERIKADLARDLITETEFQAANERLQALEAILEQLRQPRDSSQATPG